MCFVDPVLHCKSCAAISLKEVDFFQQPLKTLQQGCLRDCSVFANFLLPFLLQCNHLQFVIRMIISVEFGDIVVKV